MIKKVNPNSIEKLAGELTPEFDLDNSSIDGREGGSEGGEWRA